MNINFFKNDVAKMGLSHSFFALFNFSLIFFSYYFLKPSDFGYLTGLFVLEGILIFFDLTIYNYVINKLSKLKKKKDKQELIYFFFKKLLIFSIFFLLFNLILVKAVYWDRIITSKIYIFYNLNLSLFLSLITSLIVILRILINYLKVIFIGNLNQSLFANLQIISSLIKILTLLIFFSISSNIESLLFSYFFGLIIEFFLYLRFCNKIIKFKFTSNLNFPKFPNSLIFFALSIIFFFNIDRIFLVYNSNLDEIGKYNFFKVILAGFFILSASYYYSLLPDISKFYKNNKIIHSKICSNFKSLNVILIFILLTILLFTEIIVDDFKIKNLIEIGNINIFKILTIQTYFVIVGIILHSFHVGLFFVKIPTLINFFLLIIAIPLFIIFNKPENATNVSIIYLLLNVGWFFINLFFLNKHFKKIFSINLITFFIKNSFQIILIVLVFNLILYFFLYNISKVLFYFILFYFFIYCLNKSQQILNK